MAAGRRRSWPVRAGLVGLEVALAVVGAASCLAVGLGRPGLVGVMVGAVVGARITHRSWWRRRRQS